MTVLLKSQSPYPAFYFQHFLLLKSNEEQKDSIPLSPKLSTLGTECILRWIINGYRRMVVD